MEQLTNQAVKNLIDRAVKAGNARPTVTQLKTLAVALGDAQAARFFVRAGVKDLVAVRNALAATTVFGEEPKKVSEGAGALFGMEGKEATLPTEKQEKIYTPEPVARTTDEQKDIQARKAVPQEEKHLETSDRKTQKPAVSEPLKEQTDPKIKEILNRGEKHLNEIEKETTPKAASKTAAIVNSDDRVPVVGDTVATVKSATIAGDTVAEIGFSSGKVLSAHVKSEADTISKQASGVKTSEAVLTEVDSCSATDCVYNRDRKCTRKFITVTKNGSDACCLFYVTEGQEPKPEVVSAYAARISRGEHVVSVLKDLVAKLLPKKAVINPGDNITMDTPTTGPMNVTFEAGNMTPTGQEQLIGKDGQGNVTMVLPKGTDPMKIMDKTGTK